MIIAASTYIIKSKNTEKTNNSYEVLLGLFIRPVMKLLDSFMTVLSYKLN